MKEVYLDNAAATSVTPEVKKAMEGFLSKDYGNPGSFHNKGLVPLTALNSARNAVSKILSCKPNEIIFTGSGTESINLAIKGVFRANKGNHIITTKTEHPAVLETCRYLEKFEGAEVNYLPVDKYGQLTPADFKKAIRPSTVLASIMYANNEIGTINRIKELAKIAKKHNVLFHTDACQAGYLNLDIKDLNVDLLTINGSKIHAPKGVGLLYVRKGINIHPVIHGGSQEFGLRSGTENVAAIVGLAIALQSAQENKAKIVKKMTVLRDKLISGILSSIPKSALNGHPTERLPNNANISFLDVEGESVLAMLNEDGVYASTGSACSSKSLDPSHVILALGLPYEAAHGSIRFTLSRFTTEEDIDYVLKILPPIIKKLREISPVNLRMEEVYG